MALIILLTMMLIRIMRRRGRMRLRRRVRHRSRVLWHWPWLLRMLLRDGVWLRRMLLRHWTGLLWSWMRLLRMLLWCGTGLLRRRAWLCRMLRSRLHGMVLYRMLRRAGAPGLRRSRMRLRRMIIYGSQCMQLVYLSRSRSIVLLDRGPIDSQLSIVQRRRAGSFRRTYRYGANSGVGKSFHIGGLRSSQISMSVAPVYIVDDSDIIDHGGSMYITHIVIADIDAGDMLPWTEVPITGRRAIGGECNADVHTRTYRRPAVITAIFAPGDPGRGPLVSRHPYPSVRIIIEPVAVVECGPAPAVIGYPCPTILRVHPVATGAIRAEAGAGAGHPYVSVVGIADPGAKWA